MKRLIIMAVLFTIASVAAQAQTMTRQMTSPAQENRLYAHVSSSNMQQQRNPQINRSTSAREILVKDVERSEAKLREAEAEKKDAQFSLVMLNETQAAEMAELDKRHASEQASGITDELKQRQEHEKQELKALHAQQIDAAQMRLNKANMDYDKALRRYNSAQQSLYDQD